MDRRVRRPRRRAGRRESGGQLRGHVCGDRDRVLLACGHLPNARRRRVHEAQADGDCRGAAGQFGILGAADLVMTDVWGDFFLKGEQDRTGQDRAWHGMALRALVLWLRLVLYHRLFFLFFTFGIDIIPKLIFASWTITRDRFRIPACTHSGGNSLT